MTLRVKLVAYVTALHLAAAVLAAVTLREQPAWLVPIEVLLVLSLSIGGLILRRIFSAFAVVHEAPQLLDDGDFMSHLREVGQPEIDRLIALFNRMMDRLRQERVKLQEQHHFLSRILAVSPLGILLLDFDGRLSYANPAAERLLERSGAVLVGRSLAEIGGPIPEALTLLPVDASTVIPLWGGRRLRCHHGQFIDRGFPRSYMLVEELTEEVRQFEKAAYGKLIRMMSHEVNNSIGASNSLLHSCLTYARELPEEHRADFGSAISIAISRTDQLNAFMQSFADVIRLPQPARQPCDVREVLDAVARVMRAESERRRVRWVWVVEEPPLVVPMDRVQMEQVFLNLFKNAIEAIDHDGTVTVRVGRVEGRGVVVVEDTGAGLSLEARQNLFTPFFSTKEHGQGIGLTLVQEILTRHRFQFSLDSPPGAPTQFTIRF